MLSRRALVSGLPIAVAGLGTPLRLVSRARATEADAITLAYPADVPNWDPVSSGSPVSVSVHRCVFDMVINAAPDLSEGPSIITRHRWLDDKGMALELTLRDGVTFHNGDPLTSADLRFAFFERPKADGSLMIAGVWGSKVADVETPSPTTAVFRFTSPYVAAPALLASLPAYVMPREYFQKVGRDAFLQQPVGSGPYRLIDYQRDSRIVLEAYDKYWAGVAPIKRVTLQIIKDTSARVAAVQSGQVDFAHNIPIREVPRLNNMPGLTGVIHNINTVILIHMVNKGIYQDRNLRLAMHHAIDTQALSRAFFAGYARPLSLWASEGPTNDPNYKFAYSPEMAKALLAKSGYSLDKPAKIAFSTFNGQFPADFDLGRAIVGMWKEVGIEADLQVLEIAQYFQMTRSGKVENPVLYSWSNASADPELFSGLIIDPKRPYSVWKSDDISAKLDPLLNEVDDEKRYAGYRAFDAWAVEQGYACPLLQSTASVVHSKRVRYVPFGNGWMLPYYWSLA
jgi:peptide/nickel transport system substrate-binding protein